MYFFLKLYLLAPMAQYESALIYSRFEIKGLKTEVRKAKSGAQLI
jgi:hypothetical protein